jgi:ABC-type uncharacterized transport system permease subunit
VALSWLRTGSLPSWLGWIAAALAVVFVVALLASSAKTTRARDLFIGLLVNFLLWILATSILMLRASQRAEGRVG